MKRMFLYSKINIQNLQGIYWKGDFGVLITDSKQYCMWILKGTMNKMFVCFVLFLFFVFCFFVVFFFFFCLFFFFFCFFFFFQKQYLPLSYLDAVLSNKWKRIYIYKTITDSIKYICTKHKLNLTSPQTCRSSFLNPTVPHPTNPLIDCRRIPNPQQRCSGIGWPYPTTLETSEDVPARKVPLVRHYILHKKNN